MATKKETKTTRYTEPVGFFPESIRKQFKLGEYAEKPKTQKKGAEKPNAAKAEKPKK